jgi:hypothetical protein
MQSRLFAGLVRRAGQPRIAQLLQHALLKASFVPPEPLREPRDLTRQRTQLIQERSAAAHRIQKVLESDPQIRCLSSKQTSAALFAAHNHVPPPHRLVKYIMRISEVALGEQGFACPPTCFPRIARSLRVWQTSRFRLFQAKQT